MRLVGNLQSWRPNAQWNNRPTNLMPTKSGVLGIITRAFGPGANKSSNYLAKKLQVHVRVDSQPYVIEDYQTVSGFLPVASGGYKYNGLLVSNNLQKLEQDKEAKPSTIIIKKSYLADAKFLVAITGCSKTIIECSEALMNPYTPIFLGSKSCPPSVPIFDSVIDRYQSVEEYFKNYEPPKNGYSGYIELNEIDASNLVYDVPAGSEKTVRSIRFFEER